jgi:hypothetical protein
MFHTALLSVNLFLFWGSQMFHEARPNVLFANSISHLSVKFSLRTSQRHLFDQNRLQINLLITKNHGTVFALLGTT